MNIRYLISENGLGIAVGLIGDAQEALETRTLAENIYGVETNENLFAGLIYMKSFRQFKKFLVLREYFKIWDRHTGRNFVAKTRTKENIMQFTRRAIKQANLIIESSVDYENFMRKLSVSSSIYAMAAAMGHNH